jgi:hypothetical protein
MGKEKIAGLTLPERFVWENLVIVEILSFLFLEVF